MDYWTNFYGSSSVSLEPSSFCLFTVQDLARRGLKSCSVLDVGCGNGRDSYYFSKAGFSVTGLDFSCTNANANANANECANANANECANANANSLSDSVTFVRQDALQFDKYSDFDIIYARFFLHSLTADQQKQLFAKFMGCKPTTLFYFETRSMDDPMLLQGLRLSENENHTDHYRRYQTADQLAKSIQVFGVPISVDTIHDASPMGSDNPSLVRLVACKEKYPSKSRIPGICLNGALQRLNALLSNHITFLIPAYGTLLGLTRDGVPIDNDDDLDFWILPNDKPVLKKILIESGYTLGETDEASFVNFYDYSGIQSDFYILEDHDDHFIDRWSFWGRTDNYTRLAKDFLLPLETLNGCSLPKERENLVKYLYGERYKEKMRKFIDYSVKSNEGILLVEYL